MIKVIILSKAHRRYSSGMRYSIQTQNGITYYTEKALQELGNKILVALTENKQDT
jgi:hypothetical protein